MKLRFFSVRANGDPDKEVELNRFLASHKIAQIDRQLIACGMDSFWTICIGYWEAASSTEKAQSRKPRIDYREVLPENEFREFAALREWRKSAAHEEGVPVFAVFTNEQLAAMVKLPELSPKSVLKIEGIGSAKIERYYPSVNRVLGLCRNSPSPESSYSSPMLDQTLVSTKPESASQS